MIALDIDGTLLNSKKELTTRVKSAIKSLQDRKIPLVIASGRPEKGIHHVADELLMKENGGYILSYNGGKITDYKTGELIYQKTIPEELYEEIYESTKDLNASLLTYKKDYIITEKPENEYVDIESRVVRMPVEKVKNLLLEIDFLVDKFLLVGEPTYMKEVVKSLSDKFKERLNIFQSEPFFIEIVPVGIDKATSLERLLEMHGLSREDLIACGDGKNDVTMIHFAGLGVAMENACEEVLEVSDYIAESCDNDGVAKIIEKFF